MSRRIGFARAAADHRAAIEEVARILESHDPEFWTAPREPGKWSPAEIAQHLALSYEPALAELDGGRGYAVRLAWWTRTALRVFMVPRILAGKFPKGAPAPRESRPQDGASSPAEGARLLREKAALFESRLDEAHAARRARVTHPYFGKLTAPQILKVLAAHAAHHRDQLRPPRTAR